MKHIVNVTISNPAHDFVSMRTRQSTTNYMVEAKDEAEAILRASRHFRALGHYVHNAVIAESTLNEEVEQIDEAVKVGPENHDKSTDTVWHGVHHNGEEIGTIGTHSAQHVEKHGKWGFEDSRGYGRRHGQPALNSKEEALDALVNRHKEYAKKKANEEVEQIDEDTKLAAWKSKVIDKHGDLVKFTKEKHADADTYHTVARVKHKTVGNYMHTKAKGDRGAVFNKRGDWMDEEVEQIDELSSGLVRRYGGKAIRAHLTAKAKGDTATALKRAKGVNLASAKAFPNSYKSGEYGKAKVPATNEEVEQIDELSKKTLSSYVGKAYWDQGKRMAHGAEVYGYVAGKYGRKATRGEVFKNAKEMRRDKTRDTGVQRALSKLAKEEVEQIDEISNRLMNSAENAARQKVRDAEDAHARGTGDRAAIYKADDQENRILAARTTRYNRQERLAAKAPPKPAKPSLMQRIKNKLRSEEVEQIDELSKGTLASYIAKAAPKIRSNTHLKGHFEGEKYRHLKTVRKHSPNVNPNRTHERDPKKKEYAELLAKSAGDLSDKFALKAKNKITGIQRASAKLAKEEVELDEANARHSPEAAQAVLTPTAKIVRAAVGKTARDKAATKKYARRVAKISPDYSKKDVMDHLKSMGEEVEQVVEKAPPGAKYERMVKHIKAKYSEDGTLTPQEKAIAYATAWKAKNAGK